MTDLPGSDLSLLLEDLEKAESENPHQDRCRVCETLESFEVIGSDETRAALSRALAGTIGGEKLAAILARHGYPVGRRAIMRHRREGH